MSRRKASPFVPQLTQLESREVPSIASTRLSGGVLSVVSDHTPSNVLVFQTNQNVTVRDVLTNRAWTFAANQVGRVDVFGSAAGDTFTSRGPAANAKMVRMFGLGGNDTMSGGNGRDVMFGNQGADTLKGNGGNDKLNGGAGIDVLVGGDGDDNLTGGEGNNRLIGGGGTDTMTGGSGVDTIVSIDGGTTDIIVQGEGNDIVWRDLVGGASDSADSATGDVIHDVDGFDNPGADTSLDGDEIAPPAPLPGDVFEKFVNRPLFSPSGPSVFDIKQGALGDCFFLAGLGSAAMTNPEAILSRVVDFGDGTYGVNLADNFYRVDNRLVVARAGNNFLNYVSLGSSGSMWAPIMEKAFAHYRDGDNSYGSIEGGFCFDVFNTVFEATDAQQVIFNMWAGTEKTPAQMTAIIREMMDEGYAPTVGIQFSAPFFPLVQLHQYVALDYTLDGFGMVSTLTLYNPWGVDSDGSFPSSGNPNDGIVTLTADLLYSGLWGGSFEFAHV